MLTTGAGVAVPFAWVGQAPRRQGRLRREPRADRGPSLSYRLIAPIADRRYVQWPELARVLPGSRFAGNVFAAGR